MVKLLEIHLDNKGIPSEEAFGRYENVFLKPVSSIPSTSIFLDSQVPQFVREEHPKFLDFMKSYYDWMNLQGNVHNQSKTITQNQDIDTSVGVWTEMMHDEFIQPLPKTMSADRKQVLKYAKHFYRSKGTEKSYKLFFRMLYNTNVEFYYPRKDILKVSDGRWTQNKSIRVVGPNIDQQKFQNKVIVGKISGCTAFVDRTFFLRSEGKVAQELFLNIYSITGKFLSDEEVVTEDGAVGIISPNLSKIEFEIDTNTNKPMTGFGYRVGDEFFANSSTGRGGKIQVAAVTETGAIKKFNITNFGLNYPESFVMDVDSSAIRPIKHLVKSTTQRIEYERIENDVGTVTIRDFKTSRYVSKFLQYVEKGTLIRAVGKQVSSGVQMEHRLRVVSIFGADKVVAIDIEPVDRSLPLTTSFLIEEIHSITGTGARVKISSSAMCEYPGYYVGNNGHLSETKYIQDNHFYQQFSYLIYTKECVDNYRTYLNDLIHPLGLKFFGGFRDSTTVSFKRRKDRGIEIRRGFDKFPRQRNVPALSDLIPPPESNIHYAERNLARFKNKAKVHVSIEHDAHKDLSSATLGPCNRSVYRERFNYLPKQYELYQSTAPVQVNAPTVYRPGEIIPVGVPESSPMTTIDDSAAPYWGDPETTVGQYANIQIYLFQDVIPKSLERQDVPNIVIYKNNTLQKDNRDYIIHDTKVPSREFPFHGFYQIQLLASAAPTDVFKVAYKDKFGSLCIKTLPSRTIDSSGKSLVLIPYHVGLVGPNTRINMLPEAIVTKQDLDV